MSAPLTSVSRARIVAVAQDWIGTPYSHQDSLKGVGCDCLGLVRGVWRELYGPEPEAVPPYRPDWAEVGGQETLLEAARRWLVPADPKNPRPGDVLLFRMEPKAVVKHAAIVTDAPLADAAAYGRRQARFVHAYWGRAVVRTWLGDFWAKRLAFAFAFPDLIED